MKIKNKNILITGGAGFIGSNLVDYFIQNNAVTVLDNLITGEEENIEHHFDNKNFTFIKGDIQDSLANIDKAKTVLGYNPKYSVKQGLEEAIDWYWEYFNKET